MACTDCIAHQIGSQDFVSRLMAAERDGDAFPLSGSIELTLRCNVRCKHCYILYPGATDNEMSTEQVKQILDKLADQGVLYLLMTGGEIFARCDIKEIYLHARQRGFLLTLFTNATLITEDIADFLVKYPPRRIEITIYGHTEQTYEAITGVPGSFKRFRRGVSLLLERKLPVHLKTIVLKTNIHEFHDIEKWVQDLGVPFRSDGMVNPRLDGDMEPTRERISAAQYVEMEGTDENHRAEFVRLRALAESELASKSKSPGMVFRCGAGIKTFHVDPQGQLHPCMMWRTTPYDLLHGSLDKGWHDHVRELRSQRLPETGCTSCMNKFTCGNCAATSFLETGVAGKNVDYYCGINKERERRMLIAESAPVDTASAGVKS